MKCFSFIREARLCFYFFFIFSSIRFNGNFIIYIRTIVISINELKILFMFCTAPQSMIEAQSNWLFFFCFWIKNRFVSSTWSAFLFLINSGLEFDYIFCDFSIAVFMNLFPINFKKEFADRSVFDWQSTGQMYVLSAVDDCDACFDQSMTINVVSLSETINCDDAFNYFACHFRLVVRFVERKWLPG